MKFEVGERVQVIKENELQVATVETIYRELIGVNFSNTTRTDLYSTDEIMKLDQPEPVVVPKFVAEWLGAYEDLFLGQDHTKNDVLERILLYWKRGHFYKGDLDWVNNNLIKLIDAVLNGYVVEEEPKYYVKLLPMEDGFLNLLIETETYDTNIALESKGFKTKFTEKQIKAIDERLWAFAVPVDKKEGEVQDEKDS
ncbi:DUF1642 domain-containing protein [Listeria seeligeri]|uniref:DUF1642 domain-containing protein n=1 Tax=Listeria seeligeri TaxID=1640 RepID=UPI0022EBD9EA|nr:DUF1642 domain-containing protein [Listeria seeligeri]